jgi:hypothetical protein
MSRAACEICSGSGVSFGKLCTCSGWPSTIGAVAPDAALAIPQRFDISIDLETLSTRPDAAVVSIGAAAFNRDTGAIGETFYAVITLDSAIEDHHVCSATLQWWMSQGDAARAVFMDSDKSTLRAALEDLHIFVSRYPDANVWGNGANFDIAILEYAYARHFGYQAAPWKFWNVRDMRTIVEAAAAKNFDKKSIIFEGVAHNARDDAAHQARVISACWRTATGPDAVALSTDAAMEAGDLTTKQGKLLALADRIDHEQLWRRSGLDRFGMTADQKDRMDAGVNLRRYADILAPGHWVLVRPTGAIQFGASTLDKVVEMATRDESRRTANGAEGQA